MLRCADCGLIYLDRSSFTLPDDFYQSDYHQTYLTHIEPSALDPAAYFEKMKIANRPWAERFRALLRGDEAVLDVGCSTGHFLELIRGHVASCYGHELNTKEVAFCRDTLRLDVDSIPLDKRFAPSSFDYITLIFVLEHIAEPVVFLRDLARYLKPGGAFVILVPNADDPLRALYDIPAFRSFYYCTEHLYYYTKSTLRSVCNQAGLGGSIEAVQEYPLANHLNWGYRMQPSGVLASRAGVPDIPLQQEQIQPAWQELWQQLDELYRAFLLKNGFGDRLWCVLRPEELS